MQNIMFHVTPTDQNIAFKAKKIILVMRQIMHLCKTFVFFEVIQEKKVILNTSIKQMEMSIYQMHRNIVFVYIIL